MQDTHEWTQPFPPTLELTPVTRRPLRIPDESIQIALAASASTSPARYDIVCFLAGSDRGQPQLPQRLGPLARRGHRVFCVTSGTRQPIDASEPFRVQLLAPNVFALELTTAHPADGQQEHSGSNDESVMEALAAVRRAYGIETAIVYLSSSDWQTAALLARERWGWNVAYEHPGSSDRTGAGPSAAEWRRMRVKDADLIVGPPQRARTETADDIDRAVRSTFARVSVVVVTYNNLVFNKLCLESLLANTEYPNYEIIVVDNGSTDGTPAYLHTLPRQYPLVRIVFNATNRGFARACNQGLAVATGDVLVLLNNDTMTPPGWLTRLTRHLKDPAIGAVGPVTNRIGNEAQIDAAYATYGELLEFARQYSQQHEDELFDIDMLAMFCLAMRRDVYERIGPIDDRFETGMLEDDDYARRVRLAGYRIVCAEDVFVHHFDKASFGKLIPTGEYGKILAANRRRFEEKWGAPWEPYRRRLSPQYQDLIGRIREIVRRTLPLDSTTIVISKGDEALLDLAGRRAWHFPQAEDGAYAGYYPTNSTEAIAHLETLRARGAEFLLFPSTTLWWLEHYREFKEHLERQYHRVVHQDDTCLIFALHERGSKASDVWRSEIHEHTS